MPGSISGQVTKIGGGGKNNATVVANSASGSTGRAKTNSQGNYVITNLSAGSYTVSVLNDFYNPPTVPVNLSSNQNVMNINFAQQAKPRDRPQPE